MFCTKCGTKNSKTSKFCRECGRKLDPGIAMSDAWLEGEKSPAEKVTDTAKVGELLFQAFQNLEGGKLEDATKLCQEALRLHPESTAGHSLLAMVFEKSGELHAALRHYDRVVALNPRSVADREKRDELRRKLHEAESEPSPLQKAWKNYVDTAGPFLASKRPWPEAITAFVLTFVALVIVFGGPRKQVPQVQTASRPSAPLAVQQQQSYTPPVVENYDQQPSSSGGSLPFIGGGTQQRSQQSEYTPPPPQSRAQAIGPPAGPAPRMPRQYTPSPRLYVPPVNLSVRPRNETIAPLPTPSVSSSAPARPAPANNGTISIRRATTPTPVAVVREDPIAKARQLQMSGDYDGAISSWKQALGGSHNQGEVYQQIATCYRRLGRNSDAASNYRSAIKSYDQQIASGNNTEDAQRGKRSSELGLRISQ